MSFLKKIEIKSKLLLCKDFFYDYVWKKPSLYLAIAPKSNSSKGIFHAIEHLKCNETVSVPNHLQNNSLTYKNPHHYPANSLNQSYLPESLKNVNFWQVGKDGWEKKRSDQLFGD